jgi:CRISPR/Cas system-associated exonuclease Cas4 (RecB family)
MLDYQPIFEEAEIRVVHPELGYAGTFDAIGRVTAKPKGARGVDLTGKRIVFDFKTNKKKSVYEQHLYQLAAYELALEHWGVDVDGSAVVALGPMGDIKGKPYTFRGNYVERSSFAQLIATHRMLQEQKKRNPLGRSK